MKKRNLQLTVSCWKPASGQDAQWWLWRCGAAGKNHSFIHFNMATLLWTHKQQLANGAQAVTAMTAHLVFCT